MKISYEKKTPVIQYRQHLPCKQKMELKPPSIVFKLLGEEVFQFVVVLIRVRVLVTQFGSGNGFWWSSQMRSYSLCLGLFRGFEIFVWFVNVC